MIEFMLELIKKLETYLLKNSVDIRYEEIIRKYCPMFQQKYKTLHFDMIISDPSSEVFPLDLHIEEISDQSFECCFLINTLAVKARNKGKRVTIPSEYAPYIILQTHNSTHKNPAPNSPIILLIGKEKYLCLDGNHRLQAAFKCGKKSIGYVINEKMLDSSDFFSLYDYYNFVLSITYSPLVEGVKMNCSKDLIDGLNKYLSRVKFLLEE